MAQLPTAKDLDKLYHEKGHETLVWYAWRNALRVLPALGILPFELIWPHNTVHNLYSICQIPLLLSQYSPEQPLSKGYVNAFSHVASSNMAAAFRAAKTDNQIIVNVIRANVAAYIAAKISAVDAKSSVRNAIIAAKSATIVVGHDGVLSSLADYEILCSSECFDKKYLNSHDLWSIGALSEEYDGWKSSFFHQLESIGLQVLVENIKFLLGDNNSKEFSISSSEKISTSITNSPTLLKQLIDGEELEENHAVRVIILGNGGSGKTSLVNALLNGDGWDSGDKELSEFHRPLDLKKNFPHFKGFGDNKLDLFLWDFSGQIISYGLHSAFINENCVYILVVDSRHEQVLEEWLYQIRHIIGLQTKVIILTNWFEHCDTKQNQRYLLRKFPDLLEERSFCYFALNSLLHDDSSEPSVRAFEDFLKILWDFCLESQKFTFKRVLMAYEEINNNLKDVIFIRKSDLLMTLGKNIGSLDSNNVIDLLEKLGFILRITKDGRDYCLKPNWLMEYSYKLFYLDVLLEKNGILPWDELLSAAKDDGFNEDILRFLVDFETVN
ncbi:Rab family GTPase [Thiothrix unzii]|uniref:Uncharacterized protein n=1 Tax=Thiothrix unzii TaxID=111769 RepID=A0A975FAS5_9GAMM|nr:hypothetical protein [Thiothrix unzii]QTR54372.1 hypothetical protein J9260_04560 [Thiothrix unzii]